MWESFIEESSQDIPAANKRRSRREVGAPRLTAVRERKRQTVDIPSDSAVLDVYNTVDSSEESDFSEDNGIGGMNSKASAQVIQMTVHLLTRSMR